MGVEEKGEGGKWEKNEGEVERGRKKREEEKKGRKKRRRRGEKEGKKVEKVGERV